MEESKAGRGGKTPAILLQLKQENEQLRSELRNLSASLDEVLAKQTRKPTNPAEVREKEVTNAKAQVKHYEKEIATLKHQLESNSAQRAQELEQEITSLTQQIKEKETANRNLARLQKERGDSLDSLTNAPAKLKEIQGLTEQLKVRRKKVEKLEAHLAKEEESFKQAKEKVLQLEGKAKTLTAQVGGSHDDDEPAKLQVVKTDIEEIKEKVAQLEKTREAELAKWRKKISDMEQQVKAATDNKEKTNSEFESKEQLSRILENKIKEMKRNITMLQRRNEALSKATVPIMNIDPEAISSNEQVKEDSGYKNLRGSQEGLGSKPDLGV